MPNRETADNAEQVKAELAAIPTYVPWIGGSTLHYVKSVELGPIQELNCGSSKSYIRIVNIRTEQVRLEYTLHGATVDDLEIKL